MGCLNSNSQFSKWFANIHLSGPCNRACYFCIGQHMMALDPYNNLEQWPLDNIDEFIERCIEKDVNEVNLTGSNTDPLLYRHISELHNYLQSSIPNLVFGCRTNGALVLSRLNDWLLFDKASISIPSFDPVIYRRQMGKGQVPDLKRILEVSGDMPIKINIVLGPENIETKDLLATLDYIAELGISRVNLREPYGQPHVGDPLDQWGFVQAGERLGMSYYDYNGVDVTYWDVHYVEVESVNLYANGIVSLTYPVTEGHDPEEGKVLSQDNFKKSGRQQEQWLSLKPKRRSDE